jgi:hypothetical protein
VKATLKVDYNEHLKAGDPVDGSLGKLLVRAGLAEGRARRPAAKAEPQAKPKAKRKPAKRKAAPKAPAVSIGIRGSEYHVDPVVVTDADLATDTNTES